MRVIPVPASRPTPRQADPNPCPGVGAPGQGPSRIPEANRSAPPEGKPPIDYDDGSWM